MLGVCLVVVFFFKQKTAYEMRISDWSSDVCSSDLQGLEVLSFSGVQAGRRFVEHEDARARHHAAGDFQTALLAVGEGARRSIGDIGQIDQIGRASCRERVCQYV